MNNNNLTALITGSTSGIGKAIAEIFAKKGYQLVLLSRNKNNLKTQANKLKTDFGINVYFIQADLQQQKAAALIYNTLQDLNISIDVLVNNAGFNEYGPFLKTDINKELNMISLHISNTTEMMKYFLPKMIEKKHGYVLNIGSTASYIYCPYDAVYAATKSYILSLSKAVNAELKGTGVSITTLCPGSTKTNFAMKAGMENTLLFKLFVMKPEEVARIGYKSMKKRKVSVVVGIYNKSLVLFAKILPNFIIEPIVKFMLINNHNRVER